MTSTLSACPVAPEQTATLRLPWNEEVIANVGLGQWLDNHFAVPADFPGGDVEITVAADQIFSPLRHTETHDNRELGVMVCMDGVSAAPNPFRTAEVSQDRIRNKSR